MNRTNIEWVKNPDGNQGYTWNPITGCLNDCSYCYARKLAHGRLKSLYLANENVAGNELMTYPRHIECMTDPFYPRFWEERLYEPVNKMRKWGRQNQVLHTQEPKGIFACDMSDLFGIGIPEEWTKRILDRFQYCPQHRFYLLTKQPQNLIKFSPFPDNCWVGVTATSAMTGQGGLYNAEGYLMQIEAKVKYASLEPLLQWDGTGKYAIQRGADGSWFNWLIIGACTGKKNEIFKLCNRKQYYPNLTPMPYGKIWTAQPKIEWVEEIVNAANQAGIPVFLKNNLEPLLKLIGLNKNIFWQDLRDKHGFEPLHLQLRQEIPL